MASMRTEDYLKTIYVITHKKGYARVSDIAHTLGVNPSTVTEMLQKLNKKNYINYEKYSGVTLTRKGERKASKLIKKYNLLKEFLIILGTDEKTASEEACEIEHVVKPKTMERLTRFVEFIKTREDPQWLRKFKKYCKTGKLPKCPKVKK